MDRADMAMIRSVSPDYLRVASYFADPTRMDVIAALRSLVRSMHLVSVMTTASTPAVRVQDVMTDRVYKVLPDTTTEDAWNIMRMRRIHHLAVTQAGRVVGVLSAHDFAEVKGARARELHTVADLMTPHVVTVSPTTPIRRAANVIRDYSIGCLIVVTGRRIVGIVTAADLLDSLGHLEEHPAPPYRPPTIKHRVPHKKRHSPPSA